MIYSKKVSQSTRCPMTPDGSVVWNVDAIPEAGGHLYTAQCCPVSIADATVRFAIAPPNDAGKMVCDTNKSLYRCGSMLVKRFEQSDEHISGLPALQATVALAEGFKRIKQRGMPFARQKYHFSAPDIHSAFFPSDMEPDGPRPTWIMDFAEGEHPHLYDMPPDTLTFRRLHRALKACGMSYLDVYYDNRTDNTLMRPGDDPRMIEVVKLDIQAIDRQAVS